MSLILGDFSETKINQYDKRYFKIYLRRARALPQSIQGPQVPRTWRHLVHISINVHKQRNCPVDRGNRPLANNKGLAGQEIARVLPFPETINNFIN